MYVVIDVETCCVVDIKAIDLLLDGSETDFRELDCAPIV